MQQLCLQKINNMNYVDAKNLLYEKMQNRNLQRHCYAVEAVMRALYKRFEGVGSSFAKATEDKWGIAGLLHDADYEMTKNDTSKHVITVVSWLKEKEVDEKIIQAVYSHGWKFVKESPEPQTPMDWALYCCDELTGLIVAVTLVRPDRKLSSVTLESVMHKWKVKAFAAGVNRDQIAMCEKKLNIPLSEFISLAISAMQGISDELGL